MSSFWLNVCFVRELVEQNLEVLFRLNLIAIIAYRDRVRCGVAKFRIVGNWQEAEKEKRDREKESVEHVLSLKLKQFLTVVS